MKLLSITDINFKFVPDDYENQIKVKLAATAHILIDKTIWGIKIKSNHVDKGIVKCVFPKGLTEDEKYYIQYEIFYQKLNIKKFYKMLNEGVKK